MLGPDGTRVVTLSGMPDPAGWTLLLIRLPTTDDDRHARFGRMLRHLGAWPIGEGAWAIPTRRAETEHQLISALVDNERGRLRRVEVSVDEALAIDALLPLRHRAAATEWQDFLDDCEQFIAALEGGAGRRGESAPAIDHERVIETLRRRFRTLQARDVLGLAHARHAVDALARCEVLVAMRDSPAQ